MSRCERKSLYDGTALTLSLAFAGVAPTGAATVSYTVNLAATESLFLRATARNGAPATALTNLALNGVALPIAALVGDASADHPRVTNFDWSSAWTLTGDLAMTGASSGSQARPSVQSKLTDPDAPPAAVPLPTGFVLFGSALPGLGMVARRRAGWGRHPRHPARRAWP